MTTETTSDGLPLHSLTGAGAEGPSVAEYDVALASGKVTFPHVVSAFYAAHELDDPTLGKKIYDKYYAGLRAKYEEVTGGVKAIWFGGAPGSAVALTESGVLDIVLPMSGCSPPIRQLGEECDRLHREANRLCSGADLDRCVDEAFDTATALLVHEGLPPDYPQDEREASLDLLRSRIESLRNTISDAAQRVAQIRYFGGTLVGIALIGIAAAALGVSATLWKSERVDFQLLITALTAGGLGAWVSVLYRFSFRKVTLDVTADSSHLRALGVVRPVIGGIFGLAVYSLIGSGILPIDVPEAADTQLLFVGFVGFVSGFSERWAQDMLVLGERRLGGSPRKQSHDGDLRDESETPLVENM